MKLSIIIPAYNSENSIEKSVLSVVNQDIDDLQIIIVDDYSKDKTYTVSKKLQSNFPFIEVYQTIGKGVSDARNTGIKYASGNVIGFCDADDYFEECALQNVMVEFGKDPQLDLLCYGYNCRDKDGILLCRKKIKTRCMSSEQMLERVLTDSRIMGSVWNKFYKRDIISNILFNSKLSYSEDTAFNAEVLIRHRKLKCLVKDTCIYNYVGNTSSATNDYALLFNDSNVLKYNDSMYYIRKMTINRSQKKYVDCTIFRLSVGAYYNISLENKQKDILRAEVRRCIFAYVISIFKFEPVQNFKIFLKGLIIILDGDKGNLYNFVDKVLKAKRNVGSDIVK